MLSSYRGARIIPERPMTVTIERITDDEASVVSTFEFFLPMVGEVGQTPVDIRNAMANWYGTVAQGHSFVAKDGEEIVGVLGLAESPYWYGDGTAFCLIDKPFYVHPERRFGSVGIKLLRAGREEGKRCSANTFVVIANPDRRPKNNEAAIYAVVAGYSPFTSILKLHREPVAGNA